MGLSKHSTLLLPLIPMPSKLYSYIVARDYGFAPNPFYGFCTLATCKPDIRQAAHVGDWVVGTGPKTKGRARHIVYAMRVTETMSFNDYWHDSRFLGKRPDLRSSYKKAFGDNIYFQDSHTNDWCQIDSHHSYEHGVQNLYNLEKDTGTDRVLISDDFVYWGGTGPGIPYFHGEDICHSTQKHRCKFPEHVVQGFVDWIRELKDKGYCGPPLEWK